VFERLTFPQAIRSAYARAEEDESLEPIVLVDGSGGPVGRPQPGDSLIFYDIRGEREVELTRSLTEDDFPHFPVRRGLGLNLVTMIEYAPGLRVRVAFEPEAELKDTLTEVLTRSGHRVTKVAESEKAVHVSYFLNGKRDSVFPNEERLIVPSLPGEVHIADRPEMKAGEIGEAVCASLADKSKDILIANLANVDVVGHIENKRSVLAAVETVDTVLGRITAAARANKVTLVVTADHGTVEDWLYPDGTVNTGHTRSRVPFLVADFASPDAACISLAGEGELADVAPTILSLLELIQPAAMTGRSLILGQPPQAFTRRRLLLLILDGWGIREETYGNLIAEARTPHFDSLWSGYPRAILRASGEAVGMPANTVGNSEAGHLHLGAGRRVLLDRVRIDRAVERGDFASNPAFLWAMEEAKQPGRALHLMGIVSHYSSHGTLRHLFALLRLAKEKGVLRVFIHAFIGRRGEKPESGAIYVEKVEEECRRLDCGRVVTVMGRFWPLDREENWGRVRKAYEAIVFGQGRRIG
jgi:2,3-bisphosphoglycerate-independent phosphoglycerate mutase